MKNLILLIALTMVGAQTRPATIEGLVVQIESGKAIPDAAVELSSTAPNAGIPYTAAVAADGRFTFKDIPPGQYRLAATSRGYVRAEYGQRGPNGKGLVITLLAGQEMKDAKVSLIATGSIAGRIKDANGAPMAKVQVFALRYAYQGGRRSLTPVKAVLTDDLGEYRLYWLPPQQYVVIAAPMQGELGDYFISAAGADYTISNYIKPPTGKPILSSDSDPATPFYFPGVTDAQAASAVNVAPGADVRGIDITMKAPRMLRIRGTVPSLAGQRGQAGPRGGGVPAGPPPEVRLGPKDAPFSDSFGASVRSAVDPVTGSFEIKGVAPGAYTLMMQGAGFAMLNVDVFSDVDNVTLTLSPGVNLPIRVTLEGDVAGTERPELARLRVELIPAGAPRGQAAMPAPQQPPGNFIIRGVPPVVRIRIGVTQMPPEAYVKSIRLGPIDVLQDGLQLDRAPDGPVEVVLGLRGGSVAGTAVNARQDPLSNVTLALVPNAPRRGRFDLYKQATTDASGQFRLTGVAPGDYRVIAWEDVPANAWLDTDFMKTYENRGTAVHIEEGGSENRQVTAIPIGQ